MVRCFPRSAAGRWLEPGQQQEAPGLGVFGSLMAIAPRQPCSMGLNQSWSQVRDRLAAHPWRRRFSTPLPVQPSWAPL